MFYLTILLLCAVCAVCCIYLVCVAIFFLMIRRPPRSTLDRSSAASDVYKRQLGGLVAVDDGLGPVPLQGEGVPVTDGPFVGVGPHLSLIHISEPTRPY